jgi:hypothetical protein
MAIGDVRAEIEAILTAPVTIAAAAAASSAPAPLRRRAIPLAVVAVLSSALTVLVILGRTPSDPPRAITRFSVALPDDHRIMATGRQVLALSPDGTRVAYAANGTVYVRAMSVGVHAIEGIETRDGVTSVAFAPDGHRPAAAIHSGRLELVRRAEGVGARTLIHASAATAAMSALMYPNANAKP